MIKNKLTRILRMAAGLGLIFTTSSCQVSPASVIPPSLPEPAVVNKPIQPTMGKTPIPTAAILPTPTPMNLQELSRSVYGERLIEYIRIPAINVWAPVTSVGWQAQGDPADPGSTDWDSPAAKVGWMVNGALPDDHTGNIDLYGHNNIESSVFLNLYKLKDGDIINLQTGVREYPFKVFSVTILKVTEKEEGFRAYQQYLQAGNDLHLTLVSCYPPVSNTHRVIVLAYPIK